MAQKSEARMLSERVDREWSEQDRLIFQTVVPADHRLRCVLASIDFEVFRVQLAPYYHPRMGRPGQTAAAGPGPRRSSTRRDRSRSNRPVAFLGTFRQVVNEIEVRLDAGRKYQIVFRRGLEPLH